ncbi:MAG TPA: response regulator [Anaerolineales bacterium]|nr:response regulator [Anaerolineales bacterium]
MSEKIRVLIVDDIAETRENIRKLLQFEPDIDVVGMARTGKEGIQLAKEAKPHVVLMDINMPDMDGIQATGVIVKEVPSAQIVIVSVQSDTDYLRRAMLAGARDFLPKPPSVDELIQTIRRLGEMSRQREQMMAAPPAQAAAAAGRGGVNGKIISVFSPKGGSGKTTVATNMAIALQGDDSKVVVVDANTQFGDIGVFFNLKGKHNIANLTQAAEDELNEEYIQSVLVAHPTGVKVLLGVPTPEDSELVTAATLKKVLDTLADFFNYVIVDMASALRDTELAVFDASDRIVLIATPDIPSLANAKKFFDLAEKLEYPPDKILLIMNRMAKSGGISAASVEENLKHPVKAQILGDERTVHTSINNGVPFVTAPNARSLPPTPGVIELAQRIKEEFAPKAAAAPAKTAPAKPRSLFDRR